MKTYKPSLNLGAVRKAQSEVAKFRRLYFEALQDLARAERVARIERARNTLYCDLSEFLYISLLNLRSECGKPVEAKLEAFREFRQKQETEYKAREKELSCIEVSIRDRYKMLHLNSRSVASSELLSENKRLREAVVTETNAKNMAYYYIIRHNLCDSFRDFSKVNRCKDPHAECLAALEKRIKP